MRDAASRPTGSGTKGAAFEVAVLECVIRSRGGGRCHDWGRRWTGGVNHQSGEACRIRTAAATASRKSESKERDEHSNTFLHILSLSLEWMAEFERHLSRRREKQVHRSGILARRRDWRIGTFSELRYVASAVMVEDVDAGHLEFESVQQW